MLDIILDFKFISFFNVAECKKRIADHHYDFQAAWYCRGVTQLTGSKPQFVLIFIESSSPFRILPIILSSEDIKRGIHKINKALDSFFLS